MQSIYEDILAMLWVTTDPFASFQIRVHLYQFFLFENIEKKNALVLSLLMVICLKMC